ncbi:MAG TPA: uroporphyrinogen decarboxylase family protein [Dehalococcoidales bacterium]|nr:uroporphyrinogen decarboxylase family protein [Dehalococcoidales bacterium]
MSLSHRERVIKALSHQEPDRVPFDLGSTANSSIHLLGYQRLKAHFGVEAEDTIIHKMMQTVAVHEPILQALDIDLRYVSYGASDRRPDIPVGEDGYQDEWGLVRRKPPSSLYYDLVKSPLAGSITTQDIVNFPWPDPGDPGYTRGLRQRLLDYRENTDYAIVLRLPSVFVHVTQYLRGFEDWFLDLAADKKLAGALFDAVTEWNTAMAEEMLKVGGDLADVVCTSDDMGFQTGPMVSPELYRELFKPRHKKFFDMVKKNTSAFIHFHCCGSIYKLLDDFIELGVDVIHPVQVAAKDMDSSILAPEFGDRLSFWGGVDTQRVLPRGTTEEVKAEVRRRIRDFAPGGGYILAAVHDIQPDVPVENIIAMYEAGREYGRYPIAQD